MPSTSHQIRSSAHAPHSPSRWTCPSSPPLTTASTSRPLPRASPSGTDRRIRPSPHTLLSTVRGAKEQPHTTLLLPPPTSPFPLTTHLSHAHSHTFPLPSSSSSAKGTSSGGTVLYLRGANFAPHPDLHCDFGGIRASATFESGTLVRCSSPPLEYESEPTGSLMVPLSVKIPLS